MADHKDVVLALLGASAGFAGLTLVFLGLAVTAYQAYPSDTPARVLGRYRRAAAWVLASFGASVAGVVLASAWLLLDADNPLLYGAVIVVFYLQLALLLAATGRVVWSVLWGD